MQRQREKETSTGTNRQREDRDREEERTHEQRVQCGTIRYLTEWIQTSAYQIQVGKQQLSVKFSPVSSMFCSFVLSQSHTLPLLSAHVNTHRHIGFLRYITGTFSLILNHCMELLKQHKLHCCIQHPRRFRSIIVIRVRNSEFILGNGMIFMLFGSIYSSGTFAPSNTAYNIYMKR